MYGYEEQEETVIMTERSLLLSWQSFIFASSTTSLFTCFWTGFQLAYEWEMDDVLQQDNGSNDCVMLPRKFSLSCLITFHWSLPHLGPNDLYAYNDDNDNSHQRRKKEGRFGLHDKPFG